MKATLKFNLSPDELKTGLFNQVETDFDMNDPHTQKMIKNLISAKLDYDADDFESDDRMELLRAIKATSTYGALFDMIQEVFRPARKHGYSDKKIEDLCDKCGTYKDSEFGECSVAEELIGELEKKFYEILENNGVNLDEEYQ